MNKTFTNKTDTRGYRSTRIYSLFYICLLSTSISTDLETRVERVISRDATTREKVIERINNQMPDEIKQSKSDFVIYNNNDDKVIKQILSIIHQLNNIHSKQA